MTKIFLAGPLFTAAERSFNADLARFLEAQGLEVWLPQENEPRNRTAQAIFRKDVEGIDWADMIIACMDGRVPDSGTAWEWPAPGSEDTELGVFMEPEVSHGKTKVYTRVQA